MKILYNNLFGNTRTCEQSFRINLRFDSFRFDSIFDVAATPRSSFPIAVLPRTLRCCARSFQTEEYQDYGRLLIQVKYTGVIPKFEELTIYWLVSVPPVCEYVCGDFPQDERKKRVFFRTAVYNFSVGSGRICSLIVIQ